MSDRLKLHLIYYKEQKKFCHEVIVTQMKHLFKTAVTRIFYFCSVK